MKKLLAMLLALVMVCSLATVAFAADDDPVVSTKDNQDLTDYIDKNTTFTKKYTANNGTAPADEFMFEVATPNFVDSDGATQTPTSYPTVTLGKASVAGTSSSTTGTASVTITNYETCALGVYTYKIIENTPATKTAGVNYVAEPLYLVLTVLRDESSGNRYVAAIHYEKADGSKTGFTENTYDAGQLTVTKNIEGNMADMNDTFNFKVTLTPADGEVIKSDIKLDGATVNYTDGTKIEITFELGNGDSAVITNIPEGVSYTVTETEANQNGYTTTYSDETGSIDADDEDTVIVTNTRTSEVDTGIALDSMPFVIILAVCAVAAVMFVIKRRRVEE